MSSRSYEQAIEKVRAAERAGRSQSTLNRLWRNVFAAEDSMRRDSSWSVASAHCRICGGPHKYKHGRP